MIPIFGHSIYWAIMFGTKIKCGINILNNSMSVLDAFLGGALKFGLSYKKGVLFLITFLVNFPARYKPPLVNRNPCTCLVQGSNGYQAMLSLKDCPLQTIAGCFLGPVFWCRMPLNPYWLEHLTCIEEILTNWQQSIMDVHTPSWDPTGTGFFVHAWCGCVLA